MARTVVNALGDTLYYSGSSTGFFSATGSGLLLTGTAGNDSMWGDSSVNVTMAGGTGTIFIIFIPASTAPSKMPGKASIPSIHG